MMNKNILISICLLLISMADVSCVSAADTNATDINDIMVVENNIAEEDTPTDASNNVSVNEKEDLKPQNNTPKLDIKGPKTGTKLDIKGPKTYNIIKRTKNYDYKGKEVFFGVVDNGGKEKLVCFEAGTGVGKGAGLTMVGGSVVADTGEDLIKLLEDVGAIDKIAYGMAWTSVKIGELISGRHFSDELEEYYINQLAFGTHKIS